MARRLSPILDGTASMKRFEYDGDVYIRPIGRGILLKELDQELDAYLEEKIERLVAADIGSGWEGRLRIVVEAPDLSDDDS
jgi:hypothetical protein